MYEVARRTWKAMTRKMKKPIRGEEAVMAVNEIRYLSII
jgi:hypothetical protein